MTTGATRRARTKSAAATTRSAGTNQIPPHRHDTPRDKAAPAARIAHPRRWSKSFWTKSAEEEHLEQTSTLAPPRTASEWEKAIKECLEGQEIEPTGASSGEGSSMRARHSEQSTETRMRW